MKKIKHTFFNQLYSSNLSGVQYKNHQLKKKIIKLLDKKGPTTINEIARKFNSSSPKVNTLILELIEEQLIEDLGKAETEVGRRPHLYGLTGGSVYFLGVDVGYNNIDIGLVDFNENLLELKKDIPFHLENSEECLNDLCKLINNFIDSKPIWREKIVRVCINLSGRVNHISGYSHSFFNLHQVPLSEVIKANIGITTLIENDTRARAYYEFYKNKLKDNGNILYVNVDYGLGLGVLAHGKVQYGKSGYSGEFGHIPFFENEIICRCGKKGCLETEVSGRALVKQFEEKIRKGHTSSLQKMTNQGKEITMTDIINAARKDDMLSIELIGLLASKLGKGITTLIHLYNPELIIFGGAIAKAEDYFFLPLQTSINQYAINIVRADTQLELSSTFEGAGVLGACFLAKDQILNS